MSVDPRDPDATHLEGRAGVPATTVQSGEVPPTRIESQAQAPVPAGTGAPGSGGVGQAELPLPAALADRYEVVGPLPRGGEGYLLLVRGREDELRVVKISFGTRRRDERVLELLSAEGVDVSHVVRIFEWDPNAALPWEVMEYCEPGSLADLLAREGGALSAEQVVAVVGEVWEALEYLHGLGIWHRDLKPSNILVRSLEPLDLVLADFGMSRASEGSYALRSRVVSLGYSPPERATSADGDWWSLGMIVAELALGRNVFQLDSGEWVDEAVFDEWLRTRRPLDFSGVADPRLRRLCEGLTRWDRANRWGAEQVRAWLDGDLPDVPHEADPAPGRVRTAASPVPFTDPDTGRVQPV